MIAYIGWGSLIWDPRCLPVSSEWRVNGPELPVEFARMSSDKRVTIVITPDTTVSRTLWADASTASLDEAMEALRKREGTAKQFIASQRVDAPSPLASHVHSTVRAWLADCGMSAAVWTALPPKWQNVERIPTCDEVLAHLAALTDYERAAAEK